MIEIASIHAFPGDRGKVKLHVERDVLRQSDVVLSRHACALLLIDLAAVLAAGGDESLEMILQHALDLRAQEIGMAPGSANNDRAKAAIFPEAPPELSNETA